MLSLLVGLFFLSTHNMNFPTERLASLFPAKSDTKHGPNSVLARGAPLRPAVREKLHPFLATILPSAHLSRWMIFNSPLRGQTACTTGFSVHSSTPVVSFLPFFISVFLLLSHGNSPRHSTPVFFPSINRNSLGDPASVGVVIRTGISLDC